MQESTTHLQSALAHYLQTRAIEVPPSVDGLLSDGSGAAPEAPRGTSAFVRPALWAVAHEDLMLATLTALDVMNATLSSGALVNVSLPESAWHLDLSLEHATAQVDNAAPINEDELLVHLRYSSRALPSAAPCRNSVLRSSDFHQSPSAPVPSAAPQAEHDHTQPTFGHHASAEFAPMERSNACCTWSEWRAFVTALVAPALMFVQTL